jgi:hypothetical protein
MNTASDPTPDARWTDESLPLATRKQLLGAELERFAEKRRSKHAEGSSSTQPAGDTAEPGEHAK